MRRTSATFAADNGADLITLKRLGGWKSSTVAESYVNESLLNKKSTSKIIASALNIKKPEKTTPCGALPKENHNLSKPSTSHQKYSDEIIEEDVDDSLVDLLTITQEEYQDVLETDFYSNEKLPKIPHNPQLKNCRKNSNVTRQPLKVLQKKECNIINSQYDLSQDELQECQLTQEDYEEFFETEIEMKEKIAKKRKFNNQQNKENSSPVDLFGKRGKETPIYIFKNCNFTINNN